MDSKKMMAILVVAIVAVASIGVYAMLNNDSNDKNGTLKVAYLNKSGYESLIVAENKGFYNDLDFNVESLIVTGSGQDAVNTVTSGNADIAATGEGPVVTTLNANQDDFVLLNSYAITIGGHVWVARLGSGITPSEDPQEVADQLVGKKIGVIGSSSTEGVLKRWIAEYGITDKVTVDNINKNGAELLEKFNHGNIDVLAASEPFPTTAISKLNGYKIGSSDDINANSLTMLVTTKAIYEEKKDMIEAYISALNDATEYINENMDEAIEVCQKSMGTSSEEIRAIFSKIEFKITFDDTVIDVLFDAAAAKNFTALTKEFIKSKCLVYEFVNAL